MVPRVYATSPYRESARRADIAAEEYLTHGKVMGAITTLCGRPTLTWFKFLDVPFSKVPHPRCRACDQVAATLVNGC